jgi:hypothetical protein
VAPNDRRLTLAGFLAVGAAEGGSRAERTAAASSVRGGVVGDGQEFNFAHQLTHADGDPRRTGDRDVGDLQLGLVLVPGVVAVVPSMSSLAALRSYSHSSGEN